VRNPLPISASLAAMAVMMQGSCGSSSSSGSPEGPGSPSSSTSSTVDSSAPSTPHTGTEPLAQAEPVLLPADEQLVRISMTLRGKRPAPDELQAVIDDPAQVEAFVDEWLDTEDFGKVIRDMHSEQFRVRADTIEQLPSRGPLSEVNTWDVYSSITEEPLMLVEHVVMNDLPYTEVVTLDYTLYDELIAEVYGLPFDPEGPEWQQGHWADGRPHSGVLSSSEIFRRYRSAGVNYNRKRANFIAEAFLCEPFASRDIVLPTGIDLSDEEVVLDAINNNPACVGCHQAMDPLASFFWGYKHQLKARAVRLAYEENCTISLYNDEPIPEGELQEDTCYPLRLYRPYMEDKWDTLELRPPGFYGQPGERIDDLGQMIADDPRFATCTTRRFWSYLAHTDVNDVDLGLTLELAATLESSGFDTKALVKEIVLHPRFLATGFEGEGEEPFEPVGSLLIRPEQYQSALLDLTGFQWWAEPNEPDCYPECWGVVDLQNSDRYGFRAMAGGIDGLQVVTPSYTAIPSAPLVYRRTAAEAAAWAVDHELELPKVERRLLTEIELTDTDEQVVREQLALLHARISSELVAADSPQVDRTWELWSGAHALSGDPHRAWVLTLSALLQDARMVFY